MAAHRNLAHKPLTKELSSGGSAQPERNPENGWGQLWMAERCDDLQHEEVSPEMAQRLIEFGAILLDVRLEGNIHCYCEQMPPPDDRQGPHPLT